ncbi:MAG: MerR family transcriptional regulator [Streptosporangiales bacterium]|nr:MerR family transcriptional regulator [Streptosporangiales bacterium]
MRIGELAERAGITTRALRHYENGGLLSARRTTNGYRSYDESDLRVVEQIRALVDIGFSLDETRPFVECLREGNDAGDSCPASLHAYRQKMRELETCIARLQEVHARLGQQLQDALVRHGVGAPDPACAYFPPKEQA